MWSLNWSLNRNTAPWAAPRPGATTASPAATSREYFFSNGMASARAYGGLDSSGQGHSGGRRSAAPAKAGPPPSAARGGKEGVENQAGNPPKPPPPSPSPDCRAQAPFPRLVF